MEEEEKSAKLRKDEWNSNRWKFDRRKWMEEKRKSVQETNLTQLKIIFPTGGRTSLTSFPTFTHISKKLRCIDRVLFIWLIDIYICSARGAEEENNIKIEILDVVQRIVYIKKMKMAKSTYSIVDRFTRWKGGGRDEGGDETFDLELFLFICLFINIT